MDASTDISTFRGNVLSATMLFIFVFFVLISICWVITLFVRIRNPIITNSLAVSSQELERDVPVITSSDLSTMMNPFSIFHDSFLRCVSEKTGSIIGCAAIVVGLKCS